MNYVHRSERAEWLLSLRNPSSQPNRENIPNIRIDEVKKNLFSNDSNSEAGIYTVETKNSGNITDDATKKTLEAVNSEENSEIRVFDTYPEDMTTEGTIVVQELLVINNELIPVQENLEENQSLLDDSESSVSESRNLLVNITNSDQKEVISEKRVRKRKATPETWKKNIRKKKRETGEEYVNIKGKTFQKRAVRGGCTPKCSFKCEDKFTLEDRLMIHQQFWRLSDNKKPHFFSKFVTQHNPIRKRTTKELSRKSNVYVYHFETIKSKCRVCKSFFLNTLDISQQRVYYFFKKIQNKETGVPRSPMRGRNVKKVTPPDKIQEIHDHMNSFPTIDSHYCRSSTNRQYLESTLNLSRMYDLYKEKYDNPLPIHTYRHIFNSECNISFYKPKKDRCDKCEEFKAKKDVATDEEKFEQEEHLRRKEPGYIERNKDRELKKIVEDGEQTAVITFDLQNVYTLPKIGVKNFYYKCKLNVYNLTAHCNINNQVYNCIWHECNGGRTGNDLASALVKIIGGIADDNPFLTKIILWSDSCVPQNKKSYMTIALKCYLDSPMCNSIRIIEHKYGELGHGNVQEIDVAHSIIEKCLRNVEIASPIGLIRLLLKLPQKKNINSKLFKCNLMIFMILVTLHQISFSLKFHLLKLNTSSTGKMKS